MDAPMSESEFDFQFIVSVTGNPASKIHVEVGSSLMDLVVSDGRGDFHWGNGPFCGAKSTVGYQPVQNPDDRPLCENCKHRYWRYRALYEQYLPTETETG